MELVEEEEMRKVTALSAEELEDVLVTLEKTPHASATGKKIFLLKAMFQFLGSEDVDGEHFVKIFEYLASKSLASEASVKTEPKCKLNAAPSPHPRPFSAPFDVQRLKDFKINGIVF